MTADEIVNTLLERDKDLLTKLYEGTYEEEEEYTSVNIALSIGCEEYCAKQILFMHNKTI